MKTATARDRKGEGAPNDLVPNLPRDSITGIEAGASLVLLLLSCSELTCNERHTSLFSSHEKLVPGRHLGALRPSDYYKRKETRIEQSRNDAGTQHNL